MKTKHWTFISLAIFIIGIALSGWFGNDAYVAQTEFSDTKLEYTTNLTWEDRLLNVNAWFFEDSQWETRKYISEVQLEELRTYQEEANHNMMLSLGIAFTSLFILLILYFTNRIISNIMGVMLLGFSLMCLFYGISAPMLELEAYKDDMEVELHMEPIRQGMTDAINSEVSTMILDGLGSFRSIVGENTSKDISNSMRSSIQETIDYYFTDRVHVFEGRMYFFYQSKSVIDLIGILFKQKNHFVGIAILMFSIIIPMIKILLTIIYLVRRPRGKEKKMAKIIGIAGKWSMADVFVAGMYLAYLSFFNINTGISTESNTLIGIYYFSFYVILSVFSYFLLEKHIKSNNYGEVYSEELAETADSQIGR